MKKILIILITLTFASIVLAQSVIVKDSNATPNTLLQINDEGNYGSITITPWVSVEPSRPVTSKLSNNNGTLYWEGSALGLSNGSGWSDNGTVVRLVNSGDNVGIGTISPSEKLGISGSVNLSESIMINSEVVVSNAGDSNTLLGVGAGAVNTGQRNTFIGYNAGNSNVGGEHNTFCGFESGLNNETGMHNSFLGSHSGKANISGNENLYIGRESGSNNAASADSNVYVGAKAGMAMGNGSCNTFAGYQAGMSINSGNYNLLLGHTAAINIGNGSSNTICGYGAGNGTTDGSNNTYLGSQTSAHTSSDGSNNVFLGYSAGHTESGSDKLYIDNSTTSSPLIGGDFSTDEVYLIGAVGIGTNTPDEKFEIEFGSDNIDVEFGRGQQLTNTDATFIAIRNSIGIKYYISVEDSGNILVSTTKP